jgi:hypothetical protein
VLARKSILLVDDGVSLTDADRAFFVAVDGRTVVQAFILTVT